MHPSRRRGTHVQEPSFFVDRAENATRCPGQIHLRASLYHSSNPVQGDPCSRKPPRRGGGLEEDRNHPGDTRSSHQLRESQWVAATPLAARIVANVSKATSYISTLLHFIDTFAIVWWDTP